MSVWPELEAQVRQSEQQRLPRARRAPRRMIPSVALIATAVVAVLILRGAVAGDNAPRRDERAAAVPTATVAPSPSPVASPTPGPIDRLEVLEQPAMASTRLPSALQSQIAQTTQSGARPRLGRKAATTTFGGTFYVVPASKDRVCISYTNPGQDVAALGACTVGDQIPTGTFSGATCRSVGSAGYLLYGMLPDGARDPRLVLGDGTSRIADLRHNVWWYDSPERPVNAVLSWSHGDSVNRTAAPQAPPTC